MRPTNFENEYNNRRRVPEHVDMMARWQAASEAFRDACGARAELDIAYGDGERQKYDLFHPADAAADAPLVVYIHGGYWQRGDRKDYSCVAEPFVTAGCHVALPSYNLCPEVTLLDIVAEMASFIAALYRKTGKRPFVIGHSAGGHLAATLLASDWSAHGDAPADLVTKALSISGVFNLRPLVKTSLNDALNLDRDQMASVSPADWSPPEGRTLVAAVGAEESREFVRQSLEIAGRWGGGGATAECVVVPDSNHFSVVDQLMTANSGLQCRALALAFQDQPRLPSDFKALGLSAPAAEAAESGEDGDGTTDDAASAADADAGDHGGEHVADVTAQATDGDADAGNNGSDGTGSGEPAADAVTTDTGGGDDATAVAEGGDDQGAAQVTPVAADAGDSDGGQTADDKQ